jgi:CRISPR type III-A-associated protein Csm2
MCENFIFEINYYENEKMKKIKEDLFSNYAEKVAKCFIGENKPKKEIKNISYTQIRKFYNEVLRLKSEYENSDFKTILPYFRMLKAKVFAAYNSRPKKVNKNFKIFIEKNIDYVGDNEERFKIFCTFFEAVVAYSKGTFKE